jgi:Ca2+-binding RTX toxin-like protein
VRGGAGNDYIDGAGGNDALFGETGNDTLYGGIGNDYVNGGADADVLYGDTGDDTLEGGAGADSLTGGAGNDTYVLRAGDGIDSLTNHDTGAGRVDTVEFADTASTGLRGLRRESTTLIVQYGQSDELRLLNHFNNGTIYQVNQFRFSDGITLSFSQLVESYPISLSAGADSMSFDAAGEQVRGGAGNDYIDGAGGNDALFGETGNDTLYGGIGNDYVNGGADADALYGDTGDDTLEGGAGADSLTGGAGNDTYLFTPGIGADTLSDYDTTTGNTDILSFGTGITADQLWFRQVGNNLEVSLIGTTDKATISNWYSGSAYHLEQFKTSDGKALLDSQVQALVSAMAAFAPPAAGQTSLPADYQAALAPVIAANWT